MQKMVSQKNILLIASLLLAIGLFGWQNGIELRAEEPRRAIVSLEMLLSGEYIIPHINDWPYYNKPPVFNWLMAFFYKVFGSYEEWVVRMPSLLSLIVLAFLQYKISKQYVSKKAALLSSFFFITCGEVLLYGAVNTGEIDPFYALIVYLQVLAIFVFYKKQKLWPLFMWSYALMALGFLTKGIPSIAFQALTLLAMAAYAKKWKWLFSFKHIVGAVLAVFLCGIYFYAYAQQEDVVSFLVRQFKEASQRTGLETESAETIWQSITFPLQMAKLLLPWSLLGIFFFQKGVFTSKNYNPLIRFAVFFVLFNIPIYWISGDFKPRYYYMFLPFFTLILAHYFVETDQKMRRYFQFVKISFSIISGLFVLGIVALAFIPQLEVVPNLIGRIALIVTLALLSFILLLRTKYTMASMILTMAIARLAFNLFYIPVWQNDERTGYYRSTINAMMEITGDEQIFITGRPYKFVSDASIGPITFKEATLTTAPIMTYKIPYYITRNNEKPLRFEPEILPDRYFLVPESMMDKVDNQALFELRDLFVGRSYFLIKT